MRFSEFHRRNTKARKHENTKKTFFFVVSWFRVFVPLMMVTTGLVAVRGVNSNYHNNMIQAWRLKADGTVEYAVI